MWDPEDKSGESQDAMGGGGGGSAHEDFLYHLYRGSSMLMDDDVVQAKEELEQALESNPQDARGQGLLAGVYFRLGHYPRAIELWERLVAAYPKDTTLRVNLALVLFKTGQSDDAGAHLREALRLSPEHARAWGYLGLIQWRQGQIEEARESFLKGGQASMVARMDSMLEEEPLEELAAPAPSIEPEALAELDDGVDEGQRAAMREAAEEAIEEIEAGKVKVARATGRPRRVTGSWQISELGTEPVPLRPAPRPQVVRSGAPTLAARTLGWSLASGVGETLSVGEGGDLFIHTDGDVHARLRGLVAVKGDLRALPVKRRMKGQDLEELLGGNERPIMRIRGPVDAIVSGPEEGELICSRLAGDVLHIREEYVWAFDDGVAHDGAMLPLAESAMAFCQLHGEGTLVLRLAVDPKVVRVDGGAPLRVEVDSLLGWTGRLHPSYAIGTAPGSPLAPRLVFQGDGMVLLR